MTTMPEDELPTPLNEFCQGYSRPRGDLCHWIPLLNRLDLILERTVKKYNLENDEISPIPFSKEDERLITSILDFITYLLDKSSNRGIFNSEKYVNNLVYSISPEITRSALKLLVRLAERNLQAKTARNSLSYADTVKLLQFATCVTARYGDQTSSNDKTFLDFYNNANPPSAVSLQYYSVGKPNDKSNKSFTTPKAQHLASASTPGVSETPTRAPQKPSSSSSSSSTPTSRKVRKATSTSSLKSRHNYSATPSKTNSGSSNSVGLTEYTFSVKDAISRPLVDVVKDAFKALPKNVWLEALIKAMIAQSTANTKEGARLRYLLIQMQCSALTVIAYTVSNQTIFESKIMTEYPHLLKQLIELIVPENNFPIKIKGCAVDTFCALSFQPSALPDLTVLLSSNVSYGTLVHIMRDILKQIRSGKKFSEDDYYFIDGMISIALQLGASMQPNSMASTANGIIPLFWEFASEKATDPRISSNFMDALMRFFTEVFDPNMFLQDEKESQRLIDMLEYATGLALDPATAGERPKLCSVDYTISYHIIQWIKVILHFILAITGSARTNERIPKVLDSSFLTLTPKIISNPKIFGFRVISLTLSIIGNLLKNDVSTFGIMTENKTMNEILACLPNLLEFSSGLHGSVAKFLSSIAHNDAGLKIIKEEGIFNQYFDIVSKNFGDKENLRHLGVCLDQICTEHATLRPVVIKETIKLIEIVMKQLSEYNFPTQFFYELDSASTESEEENLLAKRYFFLNSAVSFVDSLLFNHISRVEIIKQNGVDQVISLLESPALSYDFAFCSTATSAFKSIKQLFDLDINQVEVMDTILIRISNVVQTVEDKIAKLPTLDTDIIMTDEYMDFIKSLGPLQNYLQCFLFTVFTNYGTGYSISRVLKALTDLRLEDNLTEEEKERALKYKDLLPRLGSVQRRIMWEAERIKNHISKEILEATNPLPYDPVLNSYFHRYQDSEDFKKLKELEEKLPEDVSTSKSYRIIKASRFILGSSNSAITETFSLISSFIPRAFPHSISDKMAYKLLNTICEVYYNHFTLFEKNKEFPKITASFVESALKSLETFFSTGPSRIVTYSQGPVIFFKQLGGIQLLAKIAKDLFNNPESTNEESPESRSLAQILKLFNSLATWKLITRSDSSRSWGQLNPALPNYFIFSYFFLEVRITIYNTIIELWDSDELLERSSPVRKGFLTLVSNIFMVLNEDYPQSQRKRPLSISWEEAPPSETMREIIIKNFDLDESEVELVDSALLDNKNSISAVASALDLEESEIKKYINADTNYKQAETLTVPESADGKPLMYPEDFKKMRIHVLENCLDKIFKIVGKDSDCVFTACNFLLYIIPSTYQSAKSKHDLPLLKDSVNQLLLEIVSIDATDKEQTTKLSSYCHLLGILLFDNAVLSSSLTNIIDFVEMFVGMLEIPEAPKCEWFPYVLLLLETIFAIKEVPDAMENAPQIKKLMNPTTSIPSTEPIAAEVYDRVFNILTSIDDFHDEMVALAASRLLVFFTRKHERAMELLHSSNFVKILQLVKRFSTQKDQPVPNKKLQLPKDYTKNITEQFRMALFIILRNTVETPEIVKSIMKRSINQRFSSRAGNEEIFNFMRNNQALAARSPDLFLEVLGEICIITNPAHISNPSKSTLVSLKSTADSQIEALKTTNQRLAEKRDKIKDLESTEKADEDTEISSATPLIPTNDGNDSDVSMEDVASFPESHPETNVSVQTPAKQTDSSTTQTPGTSFKSIVYQNPSGVINILLQELMSIDNLFTVPIKTEEALTNWIKENPKPEKSKDVKKESENPSFYYACFLLQAIAELVASYNVCKLEFINFSKRSLFGGSTTSLASTSSLSTITPSQNQFKPRHTAINFFLQELMPLGVLESSNAIPYFEWSQVSSLAFLCVMNLLSATDEKISTSIDETQSEPTLVFVRKFIIEAIAKAFKEASHSTNDTISWRYSKITAYADLCHRLFSNNSSRVSTGSHFPLHSVNVADGAAIAKVAYEKGFANVLTNSLSEIDLNFPLCRKPIKLLVKCLGKLARLTMEIPDNGVIEKVEDEDFEFSDSGAETPAIIRNSALSMFDANDDLSDEVEDFDVSEGDHDSVMEEDEELEELDYMDDGAQSDVGSSSAMDDQLDHEEGDMISEGSEMLASDEDSNESDLDEGDYEEVEIIVEHSHSEDDGDDEQSEDDSIDQDDEDDANRMHIDLDDNASFQGSHPPTNENEPFVAGSSDSDWESFEDDEDVDDDELERVETMLQQQDLDGLHDHGSGWSDRERELHEQVFSLDDLTFQRDISQDFDDDDDYDDYLNPSYCKFLNGSKKFQFSL